MKSFIFSLMIAMVSNVTESQALSSEYYSFDCKKALEDPHIHKLQTKLRYQVEGGDSGQIDVMYWINSNFDPNKPTFLEIAGGPGEMQTPTTEASEYNYVRYFPRGFYCSKPTTAWEVHPAYIEPGVFSTKATIKDLEKIRQKLLGKSTPWYIYGISYGTIVAVEYAAAYPHVTAGLILDSFIPKASFFTMARDKYVPLVTEIDDETKSLYQEVLRKWPKLRVEILRKMFFNQYNPGARSTNFQLLKGLEHAQDIVEARNLVSTTHLIAHGAGRRLWCEELWNHNQPKSPHDDYWFHWLAKDCVNFKDFARPFDLTDEIKRVQQPVVILGGVYDHATPIEGMRYADNLFSRSMLITVHQGHGIKRYLGSCFNQIRSALVNSGDLRAIEAVTRSQDCLEVIK